MTSYFYFLQQQFYIYLMAAVAGFTAYWLVGPDKHIVTPVAFISMSLVYIFGGALYKYISHKNK